MPKSTKAVKITDKKTRGFATPLLFYEFRSTTFFD
jgi:hypothetical protein